MQTPHGTFWSGIEAARYMGVTPTTVSQYVRQGKLVPVMRLHNRFLCFDPADVEEFQRQRLLRKAGLDDLKAAS